MSETRPPNLTGGPDPYSEYDPTPLEIREMLRARRWRNYQHKSRQDKISHRHTAEDVMMLLAWEVGEISEGVLRQIMTDGVHVDLREMRLRAIARGRSLAWALRILGEPGKQRKKKP